MHTEDMLEYERNKYERLLKSQGSGIAKELQDTIKLELLAIRDIAEYVPEDDKRRILRRLDRIDKYLEEFGMEF